MKNILGARAGVVACSVLLAGSLFSTAALADSVHTSGWSPSSNGGDRDGFPDALALKLSSAFSSALLAAAPGGAGSWASEAGGMSSRGNSTGAMNFDLGRMVVVPEPEALALVLAGSGFMGFVGFSGRMRKQRAGGGLATA